LKYPKKRPKIKPNPTMPPTPKKKILIVEDEYLIVFMLQMYYEQIPLEVVAALDCADAAVKIVQEQPDIDIISMDISLASQKTGLDAAKAIRALGINIPIVFISGNSDYKHEALSIPFAYFCEKPIGLDDITTTISEILNITPAI
jgi:CheY-like chemotaxis protein